MNTCQFFVHFFGDYGIKALLVFGYGMVMYANEFETKENQKLTEIKNILQHIQALILIQQPIIPYYKR